MKKHETRRKFLKTAGLALGAAVLPVTRGAYSAGSGTLKAVLVGCGRRGMGAARDFLKNENTKIIALADMFEESAYSAAEIFKVPHDHCFWGFDAYRKVLETDCEYVILAAPPAFRPIHYKATVEAGKHVFMEKPLCVDAPGFRMLNEANRIADTKKLKVGVGMQRHHQDSYLKGIQQIANGKYGDILATRVYWNAGYVWNRPRQPEWSEMEFQMKNWYYFTWICGDHIVEQHVHNLDVANWVMTATTPGCDMGEHYAHPVSANAMGGREVRKGTPNFGTIFDHHYSEFTYADGRKTFSQCRQQQNTWGEVSEWVIGSKGTGTVQVLRKEDLYKKENVDLSEVWQLEQSGVSGPYQLEHTDLINAIKNGTPYNEGWRGAISSMTGVLGRYASYSGKIITWDEAVANGPALMIYKDHDLLTMKSETPVKLLPSGEYPIAVPGQWKPW